MVEKKTTDEVSCAQESLYNEAIELNTSVTERSSAGTEVHDRS